MIGQAVAAGAAVAVCGLLLVPDGGAGRLAAAAAGPIRSCLLYTSDAADD